MTNRIYVDFNTMSMDPKERVYLAREGSLQAERNLPMALVPGDQVILFDEELEVQATVQFEEFYEGHRAWLAKPNWSTRQELQLPKK